MVEIVGSEIPKPSVELMPDWVHQSAVMFDFNTPMLETNGANVIIICKQMGPCPGGVCGEALQHSNSEFLAEAAF